MVDRQRMHNNSKYAGALMPEKVSKIQAWALNPVFSNSGRAWAIEILSCQSSETNSISGFVRLNLFPWTSAQTVDAGTTHPEGVEISPGLNELGSVMMQGSICWYLEDLGSASLTFRDKAGWANDDRRICWGCPFVDQLQSEAAMHKAVDQDWMWGSFLA